jgi:hypothetical protein
MISAFFRAKLQTTRRYGPVALALLTALLAAACIAPAQSVTVTAAADWREVSAAEYRQHLDDLDTLVAACRKERSAEACDPNRVGPDEHLRLNAPAEPREIRYDWLRDLLDRAGKPEKTTPEGGNNTVVVKAAPVLDVKPALPPKPRAPYLDELLAQAHERLLADGQQADAAPQAAANHASERATLKAILARREFQGVSKVSAKDRFLEKLGNWLDRFFSRLTGFGEAAHWLGWLLLGLLIGGVCLGLVWLLVRIERRARLRLVPETQPSALAPSARDWQLWLNDARAMAARELWREAIHFVYWASISRLESRRLWPADRTRTPREYLALLPSEDPRSSSLTALTRSFERTWYGGRAAASADFQAALDLAVVLGVE